MVGAPPRRGRLLTNGPHVVEVKVAVIEEGSMGRELTYPSTVTVDKCLVEPSSGSALRATETRGDQKELRDETAIRIYGGVGTWPGGPHSLVKVVRGPVQFEGRIFQQAGDATSYDASPMVRHWTVRADTVTTEAK